MSSAGFCRSSSDGDVLHDHLGPALRALLESAVTAGTVRGGVDPLDLLGAISNLCVPPPGTNDTSRAYRMVALLIDGLRYGANPKR